MKTPLILASFLITGVIFTTVASAHSREEQREEKLSAEMNEATSHCSSPTCTGGR